MKYACPNCAFGDLKPIKVTYARRWQQLLVVVPDFNVWRCDACSFTRYDALALSRLELLFGPDEHEWGETHSRQRRPTEGPTDQGPRRWSL